MSSQRGNIKKQRAQKHANLSSFKNDKYGTTEKLKAVNEMRVSNVCQRCKEVIEWKIKYKKYKPLTVPGTCRKCAKKNVKYAYHLLCSECASTHKICAKCTKEKEIVEEPDLADSDKQRQDNYLKEQLKHMRLREKRSYLRKLEKDPDTPIPSKDLDDSDYDDEYLDDSHDDESESDDESTSTCVNRNSVLDMKRTQNVSNKGVT